MHEDYCFPYPVANECAKLSANRNAYLGTYAHSLFCTHCDTDSSAYHCAIFAANRCTDDCTNCSANSKPDHCADGGAHVCAYSSTHAGTDASSMRRWLARVRPDAGGWGHVL